MKHLDVLDLSMNKMTEVPAGVGKLQVVELNLNQNQVKRNYWVFKMLSLLTKLFM